MTYLSGGIQLRLEQVFSENNMTLNIRSNHIVVEDSCACTREKIQEIIESVDLCPLISENKIDRNFAFTVIPYKIPDFFKQKFSNESIKLQSSLAKHPLKSDLLGSQACVLNKEGKINDKWCKLNDATVTFRYLQDHAIEDIVESQDSSLSFEEKVPMFLEIASHETKDSFFGYHGMSQKSRLFQDVLRAVFEEILGVDLPQNFHFLRIPGRETWDWATENGKDGFLQSVEGITLSDKHKEQILKNFLAFIENR